jgi:hypothetical protein
VGRVDDVLDAFADVFVSALNAAGITTPAQVGTGWPNYEDLTKILKAGEYQVTLYPEPAAAVPQFFPRLGIRTASNVQLVATVTGGTITFSGTATSGLNIHTFAGAPLKDTLYQTSNSDTTQTIATAVAVLLNGIGVSASASLGTVSTSGAVRLLCNVGGSGTLAQVVLRTKQHIQAVFWTPTPEIRSACIGATDLIGTVASNRFTLADGSLVTCRVVGAPHYVDDHELDSSMYRTDRHYEIIYATVQTVPATQIGAVLETIKAPGSTISLVEG